MIKKINNCKVEHQSIVRIFFLYYNNTVLKKTKINNKIQFLIISILKKKTKNVPMNYKVCRGE
jgi:hypothetical protein